MMFGSGGPRLKPAKRIAAAVRGLCVAGAERQAVARMYLIQLLLPLRDNTGTPFPREAFERVRHELTERYGGVTAYLRSPASGVWKDDQGALARDEVVMVEVVVETLDQPWWSAYRRELEGRFRQRQVLVRALDCERL